MNIAVIGTGNVGGALGPRLAKAGHEVRYGTRDAKNAKVKALLKKSGLNAQAVSITDAINNSQVIFLTVPWSVALDIVKSNSWKAKVLVDCTNPLKPDFSGLSIGHTTSAGEEISKLAFGAKVVKAFNTVGSFAMANPIFGKDRAALFIAGDDAAAKMEVKIIAEELGFEVYDAGGIIASRYLEYFAMLSMNVSFYGKLGPDFGFKLLKR